MSDRKQGLPPLQRLLMIAESVDDHVSIAARSGQMDELELLAAELREIHRELSLNGFYVTKDDGYMELAFVEEGEDEGEFVRFVEAGDTLADLVNAAVRFVPMVDQRTSGGSDDR